MPPKLMKLQTEHKNFIFQMTKVNSAFSSGKKKFKKNLDLLVREAEDKDRVPVKVLS